MRYEDASQGSSNDVSARDDTEHLAGNDFGPATGNIITGAGTVSGATGTDMSGPGGHITGIAGAGGSDNSFDANGKLEVAGQYGTLTIDAEGNYTYVRNAGSPEGVTDSFTYTLADAAGATDDAKLVIAIGNPPILQAEGTQTIQTANGVVVLPAGVELSDVHVQGRNLVITLPDGSTMVIPDGAIFVPQLVVNGVEVPASNLAALLIGSEPKPAAGDSSPSQLSSGGNFEVPVQPLDPGVPLGDLIPPTELNYTPPEFEDLFPDEVNEAPFVGLSSVNVSEEGVSIIQAPNPDDTGSPDTTNSPTNGGTIVVSDADGDPLTVTLGIPSQSLTSQGVDVDWAVSPDGHTLTGSAGGNTVITIVINNLGQYTVTLARPVDHPNAGGEQGTSFVVPVTASDGEEFAVGGITVTIEDDSPTITGGLEEPQLIVDDTTFNVNDTDGIGGAFAVSYGADGQAVSNPISYAMGFNAGATGLFDTLSGQQVVLSLEGGVVIGRAGAGGPEVFRVSVDGSGNVTLDQSRAVVHDDPADPAETGGSAATLASDNLVTVSIVATDRDGDQASLTVNIGQNLHFEDDGPSISTSSASEPQLIVDDTTLGTNASASFAGNFITNFGNDGQGTPPVAYALSVSAPGVASGLVDVATGNSVFLFLEGGVVVGREGTDSGDAATGDIVFTVSVDGSGVVTLDQQRAVQHDNPADPVESGGSAAGLSSDGLINLTATIEDGDGDTATATVGIGSNLHFEDDGPSITATGTQPTLTVDETVLADNASASFAGIFAPTFGADGQGSPPVGYVLGLSAPGADSGLVDSLSGHAVFLFLEGGQVVGREGTSSGDAATGDIVFTVSVDSAGVVTLDQQRAVIHGDPTDPDEADTPATLSADNLITLTATVEDGDGDTATATANIGQNLHFEDDGPSVTLVPAEEPMLTVDETDLPANIGPVSFIDSFDIDFGEDGPASSNSQSFTLSITAGPSGLVDTATGNQVFLFLEAGQVVGREGTDATDAATGDIVFTVSVDATTGDVSLNQQRAVVHGDPTDPDEADTPAQLSADDLIRLNVVATDADGDTASASINIARNLAFEDDGPSIIASGAEPQLIVDDTTLGTNASASFAGAFITDFGSDGQGTPPVAYALGVSSPGVNSGLVDVATGNAVFLFLEGGQVVGREGTSSGDAATGDIVFTVSVNGSGLVTLDQQRAVQHDNPADPVESGGSAAGLSSDGLITLTATIEDGDGDTATATVGIGSNLHFEDDGPSITATGSQPTLVVDETLLNTNASASFAGAFAPSFGNDGQGSPPVAYTLGVSAPGALSGLTDTASGHAVYLFLEGGQVVGREGTSPADAVTGDIVFTVSVNSAGLVTLDQQRAVVHDDPLDMDESTSPAMLTADNLITLTATVKDGDGDTATATIGIGQNLAFEDDGLNANDDTDSIIGGSGPATGNVITGAEGLFGPDLNTTDGVADTFGNDGAGQITRVASNNMGTFDNTFTGGNLVLNGQYGTLTLNQNGSYTYTRTDLNAAGVSDVFTYTVTDGDGDIDTATLTIGIADNFPTLPDPDPILLDDDVIPGAGGNLDGPGDDNPDTVPGNVVNGQLAGTGGDAPLTYNFTGLDTLPTGFTIGAGSDADTLLINQGGTLVLTVQLNQATGAFTVTQNAPIDHDPTNPGAGVGQASNFEDNLTFLIGVEVEDADHDKEPATITINVDDDTPTASASTTQPDLTTDDTTFGTNASASFAGVFTTSFGADGQAAVNPTLYTLGVSSSGVLSGLTDTLSGHAVYLFLEAGVVVGREGTSPADAATGDVVFTVTVNSTTGLVTLDQQRSVVHDNPADPVESGGSAAGLSSDGLVTLTKTITDGDGDTISATANIGSNLHFEDDGPSVIFSGSEPILTVDETLLGSNASASFAGNFIATFGNDGQGTPAIAYTLGVSSSGVLSGLTDTASGHAVYLFLEAGQVVGREGTSPADAATGDIVFTVSVNSSGLVTLDQVRAVVHGDPTDPDEADTFASLSADNLVTLTATAKDGDGDTATATVNIGQNLHFEDDGPTITTVTDPLEIANTGLTPTGSGQFVFSVGNDTNSDFDDISVSGFTVKVNGIAVAPGDITFIADSNNGTPGSAPETATDANYYFTFDYDTGDGGTATATGTLVFHKTGPEAGTYEVTLTSGPVEAFSIASVQGDADGASFYTGGVPSVGSGEVAVSELTSSFFIQFTGREGVSTPASGFGDNDLWGGGVASDVKISSVAIGVHGNSVQDKDVLDYNFFSSDPGGTISTTPTASAETVFIKVTQFNPNGSGEDFVITLKLADPATPGTYIERTFVVNSNDVLTTAPTGYPALTNGEGYIIFEPNDYQTLTNVPDNYEIVGMQLRSSTEGVSSDVGQIYNFNGAVGSGWDGTTTSFETLANPSPPAPDTNDNDVFKIIDIGALIPNSEDQQVTLEFDVTVTDGDGDSVTQNDVTVLIGDAPAPPVVLDLDGDGAEFLAMSAGVTYDYGSGLVTTAWAGADDGILIRDANLNGTVDGASEFVFGGNGQTDMEALHAQYGAQLDASDADFTMFAIWNDANSNGVVDDSELQSLAEAGITSIGLVSDGEAYWAAGGDVQVAGTATYTKADGSTGEAADAIFSTGSAAKADQEVERVAANSNSVALAAAVAAAGVAASAAAAEAPSFDGSVSQPAATVSADALAAYSPAADESFSSALTGDHLSAFNSGALAMASTSHTAIVASQVGELTAVSPVNDGPTELLEATDAAPANVPVPSTGMDVVLPALQPQAVAETAEADAKAAGTVEQVIADALHGGETGLDINALLNALPGAGLGGKDGLQDLTIPVAGDVPTWDTGHGDVYTMDVAQLMTSAPMVLHHDAVQPVANG